MWRPSDLATKVASSMSSEAASIIFLQSFALDSAILNMLTPLPTIKNKGNNIIFYLLKMNLNLRESPLTGLKHSQ